MNVRADSCSTNINQRPSPPGSAFLSASLEATLRKSGLDLVVCGRPASTSSGTGIVLLDAAGSVAAVVVGGAIERWTPAQAEALCERDAAAARGVPALH